MAADHLQFLKDKFLTDFQEAAEEFEELPLRRRLGEAAEVLRGRRIGASTPIAMKNGLYDLRFLLAECVIWAEQERDRKSKSQNKKIKIELDAWHVKKLWFLRKTKKKVGQIRKELELTRDEEAESSSISLSPSLLGAIRFCSVWDSDSPWLPGDYAREVHGLEDKLQTIKAWLCQSSNCAEDDDGGLKVVGIVGMGGVGKTTLARMFVDYEANKHFSPIIWVRCSKDTSLFDLETPLLETLRGLYQPNDPDDETSCHHLLRGKRYLLLLDNVCNLEEWHAHFGSGVIRRHEWWDYSLFPYLPRGSGGAIIVTTRFQEVGRSMAGDNNLLKLEPNYGADQLWSMFMDSIRRKQSFLSSYHRQIISRMKGEIIHRCYGLPLAAKTLAEIISIQLGKLDHGYWSNSTRQQVFWLRIDEPDKISFLNIMKVLRIYPGVMDVASEIRNSTVRVIGMLDFVGLAQEFGKFWQTELVTVIRT